MKASAVKRLFPNTIIKTTYSADALQQMTRRHLAQCTPRHSVVTGDQQVRSPEL